tara:strand:- start:203 stop:4612 length:4410 start_codon:yes stop_codon:yes gene_type:complete
MGAFDDLLPEGEVQSSGMFDDLLPEKKGSYFSGDQGFIPDVAEDIGKGMYSGVVSVPQGIAEAAAIGIDLVLDSDTASTVTEAFEYIKPELGTAGAVTEDLVAFGAGFIPIAGWLGKAGQAAKAVNSGKKLSTAGRGKFTKSAIEFGSSKAGSKALGTWAGLAGSTAGAAGLYSTAIATDGRATLSDSFSILPGQDILKTEEDTGLKGREEAKRRLRNKLRVGVEDGLLSGAVDTALKGAGMGIRKAGGTKTGAAIARTARATPAAIGGGVMKTLDAAGAKKTTKGLQKANRKFKEYFNPSGGANTVLYETTQDALAKSNVGKAAGVAALDGWDAAAASFLQAARLQNKTPVDAAILEEDLGTFLMGGTEVFAKYENSEALVKAADKMIDVRSSIDEGIERQLENAVGIKKDPINSEADLLNQVTGKRVLETPVTPGQKKAAAALKEMQDAHKTQGIHLRRLFEQYENPKNFYDNLDLSSKTFNDAVTEVATHTANAIGKSASDPNVLLKAERIVYDSLGLETLNGTSPEQALGKVIESVKEASKGKLGLVAKERPILKSVDDIFIERKEILDYSPSLRKLKGQLTKPRDIYIRTITDMAQANAAADMFSGMRAQGLVSNLLEGARSLAKGGRPALIELPDSAVMTPEQYSSAMQPFRDQATQQNLGVSRTIDDGKTIYDNPNFITAEDMVNRYKNDLETQGYSALAEDKDIRHVFGGSYGDLTGMYASPETRGALTAPLKLGTGFLGEVTGILSSMRSLSQKMTIVPSPGAQVRNIVGNVGMLAANANLGRDTDFTDMFKVFTSDLQTLDEAGLDRLARKIALTGVKDTSLVTQALKAFKEAGADLTGANAKLVKAIDLFEGAIPFMKFFERVYSDSDSFFKGLSLLGEETKIRSAFAEAGILEGNPLIMAELGRNGLMKRRSGVTALTEGLDDIEVMAGDIVKDTMPIYSRVGKAVRSIDMVPIFGNFTSFASENIRNSVNILDRGLKEMSFEISPAVRKEIGEERASAFEKQIRGAGAQRLVSYAAVATVIPQSIVKGAMIATGTTAEEMEALQEQTPGFVDGHDLVPLSNDKKGKIDYIDLSYVSPYAFVLDPVRAAIQRYTQQGKLGKSEAEQIVSGAWRGLEMYLEPFGSESMIYERLRDVIPSEGIQGLGIGRGGKTSDGADIYAKTEALGSKFAQGVTHILGGIIPSYARLAAEEKGGEMVPGRMYRAATGLEGRQGESYNMFKEGARLVTGFTPMRVDLRNDFEFKGFEYGPRRTDAKTTAQRVIKRPDASMSEMNTAWSSYLDNLHREQSKLYSDIQSARKLGLSEPDIRRNLVQGANLGRKEVSAIMDGRFYPTAATAELSKDLNYDRRREGRSVKEGYFQFDSFNRMSRERLNEPLSSGDPASPTLPSSSGAFDDLLPSGPSGAFEDLLPTRPASNNPPAMFPPSNSTPTGPRAPVNPALLGGTPAERAANAFLLGQ